MDMKVKVLKETMPGCVCSYKKPIAPNDCNTTCKSEDKEICRKSSK